jgi:hypothetical protein
MKFLPFANAAVAAVVAGFVGIIGSKGVGFVSALTFHYNHPRQEFVLHAKRVSFKEDARRGLISGINQVADAVRVTLGPKVRTGRLRMFHCGSRVYSLLFRCNVLQRAGMLYWSAIMVPPKL